MTEIEDLKEETSEEFLNRILSNVVKFKLGNEEVIIDPKRLEFNEDSLNKFQEELAIWYDYFGQKLADAEFLLQVREHEYDVKYSNKYAEYKESGCTDKLAEANAKTDSVVQESKKNCLVAKQRVRLLQQHLRAWDKVHDNSQSRGHMIRKEIDKFVNGVASKTVDVSGIEYGEFETN